MLNSTVVDLLSYCCLIQILLVSIATLTLQKIHQNTDLNRLTICSVGSECFFVGYVSRGVLTFAHHNIITWITICRVGACKHSQRWLCGSENVYCSWWGASTLLSLLRVVTFKVTQLQTNNKNCTIEKLFYSTEEKRMYIFRLQIFLQMLA